MSVFDAATVLEPYPTGVERLQAVLARRAEPVAPHRRGAAPELDDPDRLRLAAEDVRQQVLGRLPELLERFADAAVGRGARVYWASSALEARDYVVRVVQAAGARRVVRARSAVTEEIRLDSALEARGTQVVGTDHLLGTSLHPEVGVTSASLAVADTGSVVLVTDDVDGRLVATLPPAHVVVLGMERLVAGWHQADVLLALLARSAGGQRRSSYTTVVTGPRGPQELDGPDELHIVVLDNGRSQLLYPLVSDHAYAWTDPPIAAVAAALDHGRLERRLVDATAPAILRSLPRTSAETSAPVDLAAWQLWAAAWSDAQRYAATTRAATWNRLASGLEGRLPIAPEPAAGDRFRDRWRKGLV